MHQVSARDRPGPDAGVGLVTMDALPADLLVMTEQAKVYKEFARRLGKPVVTATQIEPPRRRHISREDWRWYQDMTFATRYGMSSRYLYSLTLFGKAYEVWQQGDRPTVLLLAHPFYVD